MNNNAARNPFIYGGMVSGETFCDREAEIAELMEDIRSKQHVIVFSQRRMGKTSLVSKVLEEARVLSRFPWTSILFPHWPNS